MTTFEIGDIVVPLRETVTPPGCSPRKLGTREYRVVIISPDTISVPPGQGIYLEGPLSSPQGGVYFSSRDFRLSTVPTGLMLPETMRVPAPETPEWRLWAAVPRGYCACNMRREMCDYHKDEVPF